MDYRYFDNAYDAVDFIHREANKAGVDVTALDPHLEALVQIHTFREEGSITVKSKVDRHALTKVIEEAIPYDARTLRIVTERLRTLASECTSDGTYFGVRKALDLVTEMRTE